MKTIEDLTLRQGVYTLRAVPTTKEQAMRNGWRIINDWAEAYPCRNPSEGGDLCGSCHPCESVLLMIKARNEAEKEQQ
jgi:hypothetical protein